MEIITNVDAINSQIVYHRYFMMDSFFQSSVNRSSELMLQEGFSQRSRLVKADFTFFAGQKRSSSRLEIFKSHYVTRIFLISYLLKSIVSF